MSVALQLPKSVVLSFPTDADFSSSRYYAVKSTGLDTDVSPNATAKATGFLTANVADFSTGSGRRCDVIVEGGARAVAAAAIAFDVPVMVDTANPGKVITATDGLWACGYSRGTPAADGDEFPIEVSHFFYEIT